MDVKEAPVLEAADEGLVDRFAVGPGDDAARVLAQLQTRTEGEVLDRRASVTTVRPGAGVIERAARDALASPTRGGVIE